MWYKVGVSRNSVHALPLPQVPNHNFLIFTSSSYTISDTKRPFYNFKFLIQESLKVQVHAQVNTISSALLCYRFLMVDINSSFVCYNKISRFKSNLHLAAPLSVLTVFCHLHYFLSLSYISLISVDVFRLLARTRLVLKQKKIKHDNCHWIHEIHRSFLYLDCLKTCSRACWS